MVRISSVISGLIVLLCSFSCSTPVEYDTDYQTSFDFSILHSYAWHTDEALKSHRVKNDIIDQRIVQAIENTLNQKGFKLASPPVDFYVNYGVTKEDKVDIRTYNTYAGYAPGFRYHPWGAGIYPTVGYGYNMTLTEPETRVVQYVQGTLVIDIVKADTNQIVWRGTAAGKLGQDSLTAQERDALINDVVKNVLSEFPPKQ